MKKWFIFTILILFLAVLLIQCRDEIAGYISPSPTPTLTSTSTPTQTYTYTPVPSDTPSITPTTSDTPTITPSPTSIFFDASIYSVDWLENGHLMISIDILNLPDGEYMGKITEMDYPCRILENLTDRLICVGQALEHEKEYKFTLFNSEGDELFFDMIYVVPQVKIPASGDGGGGGGVSSCPAGEHLTNGHCCPVDFKWNGLYCEKDGPN